MQFTDQFGEGIVAIAPGAGDLVEHEPGRIDHAQQRIGHVGVEKECTLSKLGQQVLAGVRKRFEIAEGEEARRALDGVDRTEDLSEQVG